MARFRARDLRVETKADRSPVTEADRGVEELVRARLETERPDDAIVGEEFGPREGTSGRRWVIDPVDGTMNFSRGAPIWGTLLALQDQDRTVVGVASAPALGRRWWAARGEGAYADGESIHVSEVSRFEDALLCYTSVRSFDAAGVGDAFRSLTERAWTTRGFSDFWGHMLVAEGTADVMLEPALNLWDYAPLDVIVEEAGGRFSDFGGAMPTAMEGASGISSNGLLHSAVLDVLKD